VAVRIDRAIRRHGARLADLQLEVGMLAASARELVSVVAVAHHADASGQADASGDSPAIAAADVWCRLALARAAGRQPTSADLAAVAALGERVVAGTAGFPA
jgi:hypothetical protein